MGRRHEVDLYEAADRLGGHVNTVDVTVGDVTRPVDTGFIVHNPVNFPNLVALFDHLGVATEDSDMSLAVSARNGALEYAGGRGLRGLFAQPVNVVRPAFWRMLGDILRFNRLASRALDLPPDVTLGDWLDREGFSAVFRDDHLLPMTAAIWSASRDAMLAFPAAALFRFLDAHCLLQLSGRPQWRTVAGGCRSYVKAVIRDFSGNVHTSTPVRAVRRESDGVKLELGNRENRTYDAVILATHADISLELLDDADAAERNILAACGYAENRAVLHRDTDLMPKRRAAWASWNYMTTGETGYVTYWMNSLQNITDIDDLFVTLDPPFEPKRVIAAFDYAHPQFDAAAISAQQRLSDIQGRRNTWFCGSWCGYGFHEDGLAASIRVAADFDAAPPWQDR